MRSCAAVFVCGLSVAAACSDPAVSTPLAPAAVTITSLGIIGLRDSLEVGARANLTARATYSDGHSEDATPRARWATRSLVCLVDAAGQLSAVSEGHCEVEATFESVRTSSSTRIVPSSVFTISGVVREKWGLGEPPIPFATVTLISGTQTGRGVTADANGRFEFTGVPKETIGVRARADDFDSNTRDVSPAASSLDFELEPTQVIDHRHLPNNPPVPWTWTFERLEIPFTVTRRGPLTFRIKADGPCEVSYQDVMGFDIVGLALPHTRYTCHGTPWEWRQIVESGTYRLRVSYLPFSWMDPKREVFLSRPR